MTHDLNMAPDPKSRKRRVFLVDDHALVREWLTTLINQQPDLMVCGEAETASKALQTVGAATPDIIVVDILLKDSSGIDLIKALKQSCPGIAVMVLSMHEEPRFAERAVRAGARGYVTKAEATREVIAAIRRVLQGGVYLSNSLRPDLAMRFVAAGKLADDSAIDQLSDREIEVFQLLGQGQSVIEIAEKLRINSKTVHTYCARIKSKLHLETSTQLLHEAFHWFEGN